MDPEKLHNDLMALLGKRASTAESVREQHSHGESYHPPALPDVVCFPANAVEVSEILKISQKHGVPVVPFGAGTSIEGQVNAVHGGISLDLTRMNKILRVSPADLDATVEAGVTRSQLNRKANEAGLMFSVDPGADATLGGMAATRASGTTSVRYGTMRENVLGLTIVLADGRVIRTGSRARKSSAGYDLTHLFVGSEGTLGVITELTLRLHPLPEAVSAAVCAFDTLAGAIETVIETIQLGIPAARMELLDECAMDAVNRRSGTSYELAPTLFFEFHGAGEKHVADHAKAAQSLAEEHGGHAFHWATSLADREKLWHARHEAYYASLALRPGAKGWTTDVCVPISRLADCILQAKKDHADAPFPVTLVGHAGDGNFHLVYVLDPGCAKELAAARRLSGQLVERALAMGGTCTGEHGIGTGKLNYMAAEHGAALEVMRAMKRVFDPENRMNPGKMILTKLRPDE
jgi:D-lactate dehydrogenase (cytochrome)